MSESFFHLLKPDERKIIEGQKILRTYKKGQTIFREGDFPSGIFCLQHGKVKVFKQGTKGQQTVRLAKPGDLLGYRALLAEEEYNATAATLELSQVVFLKKGVFISLLNGNPKLSQHLLLLLCHDLRFAEDRLLGFVQMSSRGKMAETLLFLKEAYGKRGENSHILIDVSLNRQDLAELAGVVLETAVRVLGEFKRGGLIQFEAKKIILLDLVSLQKIPHFQS